MHARADDRRRDARGKVAVADQFDASPGLANVGNQFFVTRAVEHDHDQVVDAPLQATGDVLEVVGDRGIQIDRVLAGRPDHDFFHVAVGRIQQTTFLRRRQHRDCTGSARRAQIGAFEGIDSDIDLRDLAAIGKFGADFLADVEHGRFVALAFANDDIAAHGDGVHRLPHGLGCDLVCQLAIAGAHGARGRDSRLLDHAQEFKREIAFNVDAKALYLCFDPGVGCHKCPPQA